MQEIAQVRVRHGFWRIFILLRREGWKDNHRRVHRLYKEEGLNLRAKRPRRTKAAAQRLERPWSFLIQRSARAWILMPALQWPQTPLINCGGCHGRQCPTILVGLPHEGRRCGRCSGKAERKKNAVPKRIQVDNGSEFISRALDMWAFDKQAMLDFSRPGKHREYVFTESFNGSLRDECLNANWFLSLEDAREKIEDWRQEDHRIRPLCS